MRYLWIILGWVSVGLGVIGAFLPLLPTTPFLLLAAYAFSRGSQRLNHWLITHPKLGPPIQQWQEHRAISRKAKIYGTISMGVVVIISLITAIPYWVLGCQVIALILVTIFLWRCPEPPTDDVKPKPLGEL